MATSSSWMLPLKAVLVSTGVVSMALIFKLSLPLILDFLNSDLPLIWSFALSWLRPPYLYLLINCIILSIVASSKLQPRVGEVPTPEPEKFSGDAPVKTAVDQIEDVVVFGYVDSAMIEEKAPLIEEKTVISVSVGDEEKRERSDDVDEFVVSNSLWSTPKRDPVECSPISSSEKPPVSSRFGHRRTVKASPEGKSMLKVSKPKRQETLETTWRTIAEGRAMPLTRHLRKSDTFASSHDASPVRVMKKSETFVGNSSPTSGSGGKLRREPTMSQDELNRRVEAFIKKFNEEMRLQRQESLNQYREMVSLGTN